MDPENDLRLKLYIGLCGFTAVAFVWWLVGYHISFQ